MTGEGQGSIVDEPELGSVVGVVVGVVVGGLVG